MIYLMYFVSFLLGFYWIFRRLLLSNRIGDGASALTDLRQVFIHDDLVEHAKYIYYDFCFTFLYSQ